ncbi:RpiR family carbohydrate utilization transcriptional regulator [Inquilinus ginsengisoli]|uniref:RpiR family carbohydrate utilization transcriptional regulator n=1 Tax=Inquilinus ginsengisoli TaxID=363840 RepID=A0ABU1JTR6_9PROT|nr:SIS domain-containing protein [Inquilinus ginsengisoli]MDR6291374.1 RpiR family carbohydrate utilization transcriptional regulator [Inquilinus ginsengisoli]
MAYVVDIVSRLRRMEASLRPSEQRVAEAVLADPGGATHASIAELARRAQVSEPSVTRFCRALGCDSVRDFKVKLAQNLAVASPYLQRRPQEGAPDDVAQLADRVLDSVIEAVTVVRDQLDPQPLRQAIDGIAKARRLDIYGIGGGSHAVGHDAYLRFFRLDLPTDFHADTQLQRMSAATLGPGDCVLAVCNSGRFRDLVESVEIARHYGATTIALTRPDTPLARAAEILLAVAPPEDSDIFKPTASRLAHMAVIDVVATGVAMRRGPAALESLRRIKYTLSQIPTLDEPAGAAMRPPPRPPAAARRSAPGKSHA